MSGVREENVEDIKCEKCGIRCAPQEFFDHLISKTHIRRNGGDVLNWSEEAKSRSVMVFSSFCLVGSKAVGEEGKQDKTGVVAFLQKCSGGGRAVVNFVGWEESPRLGVVQFKTKKMAKTFMQNMRKGQDNLKKPVEIRLDDDHVVEAQLLSDLGNLQLAVLMPAKYHEKCLQFPETEERNAARGRASLVEVEDAMEDDDDDDVHGGAIVVTLEDSLENMEVEQFEQESQDNGFLSDDNNVEGGAGSQGGSQAAKKSKSKKRSQNKTIQYTKNAVTILESVVQQEGWGELKYSPSQNPVTGDYSFCVSFGDCKFTPGFGTSNKCTARRNAAVYCLKYLQAAGLLPNSFVKKLDFQYSIHYQYLCILNLVGISDEEYRKAMEVVTVIKSLYLATDLQSEVLLYNSWSLKLRDPLKERDEPVIFVRNRKPHPTFPESFVCVSGKRKKRQFGSRGQYTKNGITFRLLYDQEFLQKAWMTRMVEYLCTFESRCQPLLTLLYYWASCNSELLSQQKSLLEPVTMQWMVIFFLRCGKTVIPPPEQIIKRCIVRSSSDAPAPFHEDKQFHQAWVKNSTHAGVHKTWDQFILAVLWLFRGFLSFYGVRVAGGNYILHTGRGHLFPLETIRRGHCAQLSEEDRNKLLSNEWIKAALKETKVRKLAKVGIYLSDPFDVECSLPLPKDIYRLFRIMKVTAKRLKTFQVSVSNEGMKKTRERFGALQDFLKIDETDL